MIGLDHLTFEGSLVLPTRTRYRLTRLILVGCMKLNSLLRLAVSGLAGRLIGWSFGLLGTFFGVPGRYCITIPPPNKDGIAHQCPCPRARDRVNRVSGDAFQRRGELSN